MIYNSFGEIISIDGNEGSADDRFDAETKLTQAWRQTGTWATLVQAGAADQPMVVAAHIDADGVITWNPKVLR